MTDPITPNTQAPSEDHTWGDIVWGQFRKNRPAYWSMYVVIALVALAVFAPALASGRPYLWSAGEGLRWPWLSGLFDRNYYESPVDLFFNVLLVAGVPCLGAFVLWTRSAAVRAMPKRPRRRRIARGLLAVVAAQVALFVVAFAADHRSPYMQYRSVFAELEAQGQAPTALFPPVRLMHRDTGFEPLAAPSAQHLLGVDQSTRDVGVRLLYGTRISMTIGIIAVAIYVFIGVILGALGGYFGGRVDLGVQRLVEVMMCLPTFFVVLTLVAFIDQPSIFHIMVIIGLVGWTGVARLVRAEFLRLRKLDFVTAAVALGYPTRRIIFEHILPNALGPVLVSATFGVAAAILVESTLSFLGLGDVSAPSWGQTLREGYASGAWHLILAPGFAIFVTVSALNLVGEGLRDALDPKLRR